MIEIGKQYRLNIRPNPEYRCPNCDIDIGEYTLERGPSLQGLIVTVTSDKTWSKSVCCTKSIKLSEGHYTVRASDNGESGIVLYTWLEKI